MKIKSLTYLNENVNTSRLQQVKNASKNLGIDIDKTKNAVLTNQEQGNTIKKKASINKYRIFQFGFINNSNNQIENQIFTTFVCIYKNDTVAFYPFLKQGIVLDELNKIGFVQDEIPSYFSLKLVNFQNQLVHPSSYFNDFVPDDMSLPNQTINSFRFELVIGPNFDNVNKAYNINDKNILNLKNFASNGLSVTHLIKFFSISNELTISNSYDDEKNKKQYIITIRFSKVSGLQYDHNEEAIINRYNGYFSNPVNNIYNINVSKKTYNGANLFENIISRSNVSMLLLTRDSIFDYTRLPTSTINDGYFFNSNTTNGRTLIPIKFNITQYRPIIK
jgi:hypothetical protein